MACIAALGTIQMKRSESGRTAGQANHQRVERLIDSHPALGQIQAELRPHSGLSAELLRTQQGCLAVPHAECHGGQPLTRLHSVHPPSL
jgi:hypothetical protein